MHRFAPAKGATIILLASGSMAALAGHPAVAQVQPLPPGFHTQRIATNGTTLYVRAGGTIALGTDFLSE